MSSSGITAANSGPLILRTYLNSSINNTYVAQQYDYPVSSNRLLITSTAGLLVATDSPVISSLTVSTHNTSTITTCTMNAQTVVASSISSNFMSSVSGYISSLSVSSFTANSFSFSTIIASTVGIGTNSPQCLLDVSTTNTIVDYSTAGAYTQSISSGVTSINFEMIGAGGSGNYVFPNLSGVGGTAGYIKGTILLPVGTSSIKVVVGTAAPFSYSTSGASYINISTTGPLFVMAGAGGGGVISGTGGYGGGGTFPGGVAPGGPGTCGGNSGGSMPGLTLGGLGYEYNNSCAVSTLYDGANRVSGNVEEAAGGSPVNQFGPAGGSGYAGGGAIGVISGSTIGAIAAGGGGGSSYINPVYINTIVNFSSFNGSAVTTELPGFGRDGQSGRVILTWAGPAICTNGNIVADTFNGNIVADTLLSNSTFTNYVSTSNILIGPGIPTYPLEITSAGPNQTFTSGFRYGFAGQGSNVTTTATGVISLKIANSIWADTFFATSDQRIKKDIKFIQDSQPLGVIREIKPVSYQYIDRAKSHHQQEYGFIAQDVKSVLPYAVTQQTDYIPNLYDLADFHRLDEHASMVTLRTKIAESIKIQDWVKLVDLANKEHTFQVVDVNYNYFVVDADLNTVMSSRVFTEEDVQNNIQSNTIFVYGTKVDDLHILNKEAIFSVGIGAIQELDRVVQQQQTIMKEQSEQIKTLEEKMERLLQDTSSSS